jgi:glycosyltransferase involved in cell wall biosynthesis
MVHYAASLAAALSAECAAFLHVVGSDEGLSSWPSALAWIERFHPIRQLRRYYNPWRARAVARGILQRYAPTIVHLNGSVPCLKTTIAELQRSGIAVFATLHDPIPHEERRTLWGHLHTALFQCWLLPRSLAALDRLHVHSTLHRAQALERFPRLNPARVYVVQHGGGIPPGVAGGSASPAELSGVPAGSGYLLFFGRIEPYKGLQILLSATAQLLKRCPKLKLVIAGAGAAPLLPRSLETHVILINRFIADQEVRVLVSGATAVVLPYLEATQTGVVPLAAAWAVPAIVTRVGALPELVIDEVTGLIVDPGDPVGLSCAMARLHESPGLARALGNAARGQLHERYSWPIVAGAHFQRYTDCVGQGEVAA